MEENPALTDLVIEQIRRIMEAINQDEAYVALNEADLMLEMMGEKFLKEHKLDKLQKEINHFLMNNTNRRLLRLNQRIKKESDTAIEYYDKDIGNDTRLDYQTELETDLADVLKKIKKAIAIIVNKKLSEEIDLD